ncbi:nuclear transport factor 2 family protein [Mycobacterium sp. 48b]|uniref:nuclear transport factor 2 family protein n=1 Tax=Mycobacterium sp. 48b TaxID=3400426 RepID=UPI003AABF76E
MPSEFEDRLAIESTLRKYAMGLDERRFDLWADVFTEDAIIDFTPMGGKRERPGQMSERLSATDANWLFAQHPLYNTVIDLSDDSATAFSDYGLETGRQSAEAGEGRIIRTSGGGSYRDALIRTPHGWRITERKVYLKWKRTETVVDELGVQRTFRGEQSS